MLAQSEREKEGKGIGLESGICFLRRSTEGSSVYVPRLNMRQVDSRREAPCNSTQITMPPCKRCFMALVAAGVRRIVTRKEFLTQDSKERATLPCLAEISPP